MAKITNFLKRNAHWAVVVGSLLVCGFFLIITHPSENGEYRTLDGRDAQIYESTEKVMEEARQAIIEYSSTAIPALIQNADGTTYPLDAPTVEKIDDNNPYKVMSDYCPDGEECGMGAYIYAPTETFQVFRDYVIGKCWNVDGYAGSQCWDLSSLHSMNYTKDKRTFSTCGTGAARGMWDCRDVNAGTEYAQVFDKTSIKTGDIIVTGGGTWGHACEAAGPYNNGYVACLGQNQGGSACPGGGAAANIINLSLNDFLGAFRPKTYKEPEPTPDPNPTPISDSCSVINVVRGDTMGAIMKRCRGEIVWGSAMNDYASHWYSTVIRPGQSVYTGWISTSGVGLFAGDTIEWRDE